MNETKIYQYKHMFYGITYSEYENGWYAEIFDKDGKGDLMTETAETEIIAHIRAKKLIDKEVDIEEVAK